MTNVSEYGDLMLFTILDEWGRRKIDSLMEDGISVFGLILKEALDSISLGDAILRDKTFIITDNFGLAENIITGKILFTIDSLVLSDAAIIDKILGILDAAGLSDLVEKIVAGVIKPVLYLLIDPLAVSLKDGTKLLLLIGNRAILLTDGSKVKTLMKTGGIAFEVE